MPKRCIRRTVIGACKAHCDWCISRSVSSSARISTDRAPGKLTGHNMDPGRLWDAYGRPLDGRSCPGSVRPLAGLDALGPRQVLNKPDAYGER